MKPGKCPDLGLQIRRGVDQKPRVPVCGKSNPRLREGSQSPGPRLKTVRAIAVPLGKSPTRCYTKKPYTNTEPRTKPTLGRGRISGAFQRNEHILHCRFFPLFFSRCHKNYHNPSCSFTDVKFGSILWKASKLKVVMTDKFPLGIGIAASTVLVLAIGAVALSNPPSAPSTTLTTAGSSLTSTAASQEQASGDANSSANGHSPSKAPNFQPLTQSASLGFPSSSSAVNQPSASTPSPLQPGEGAVPDSALQKLAAGVHLNASNANGMNKDLWAQQVPLAQKLVQGMCDCEQRNWLNQFIATGNFALADDAANYYPSLNNLVGLPRSDAELIARNAAIAASAASSN